MFTATVGHFTARCQVSKKPKIAAAQSSANLETQARGRRVTFAAAIKEKRSSGNCW